MMDELKSFLKLAGVIFFIPLLVLILWNWVIPDIFNLREITYWESFGLNLLSNLFFKSYRV